MTAQLLAGGPVAEAVLDDVRTRVEALAAKGITPGLGTILVGDDGASAGYVRKKHETCESVGFTSQHIHVPADAAPSALDEAVAAFNEDPAVHAYIIQHPVPSGFDFNAALGWCSRRTARCRARRPASRPCSCTTTSTSRAATWS